MRIAMSFPSLIGSLAVVGTGRVSSGAVVAADTRKKFVHKFFQNIERSRLFWLFEHMTTNPPPPRKNTLFGILEEETTGGVENA